MIDTFQYILVGNLVTGAIISPILILIALFAYLTKGSALDRIPINTTLYESIVNPTIQYGPIRLILPVMGEDIVEEVQLVDINE